MTDRFKEKSNWREAPTCLNCVNSEFQLMAGYRNYGLWCCEAEAFTSKKMLCDLYERKIKLTEL